MLRPALTAQERKRRNARAQRFQAQGKTRDNGSAGVQPHGSELTRAHAQSIQVVQKSTRVEKVETQARAAARAATRSPRVIKLKTTDALQAPQPSRKIVRLSGSSSVAPAPINRRIVSLSGIASTGPRVTQRTGIVSLKSITDGTGPASLDSRIDVALSGKRKATTLSRSKKKPKGRKMQPAAAVSSASDEVQKHRGGVVGTSQSLEKRYLRLTKAPDPSTVRPLPVLKQSLAMIKRKWLDGVGYEYVKEQLKCVRQDLTIQNIRTAFTVDTYETHARIALESGDLDEFTQCLARLTGFYAEKLPGHQFEFCGYQILCTSVRRKKGSDGATMALLAKLTKEQRDNVLVQHAIEVHKTMIVGDFYKFFSLYKRALNMSSYVMDYAAPPMRRIAIETFVSSFRPTFPVAMAARILAFKDSASCATYLKKLGVVLLEGGKTVDCARSLVGMEEACAEAERKNSVEVDPSEGMAGSWADFSANLGSWGSKLSGKSRKKVKRLAGEVRDLKQLIKGGGLKKKLKKAAKKQLKKKKRKLKKRFT